MKNIIATIGLALWGVPVMAQSSLGIQGLDVRLSMIEDEGGEMQSDVLARLDVAVTDYHGLQGDVAFADTDQGLIGQLAAHFYMTPNPSQKYGVFAALSDVDGRTMTWGSLGVEGMIALSENLTFEGRTGLGVADVDSLDYIFADLAVAYAAFDGLDFETALTLTEIDETAFRAISYDGSFTARFSPKGTPWGVFAQVSHSGLSGRESVAGATRLGVGIMISLGQSGGVAPKTRPFRTVDPVAPLVRRDLW